MVRQKLLKENDCTYYELENAYGDKIICHVGSLRDSRFELIKKEREREKRLEEAILGIKKETNVPTLALNV